MKSQVFVATLPAAAVLLLAFPSATKAQVSAQDDPNPPWKEELSRLATPRTADGKPDLSGLWQRAQNRISLRVGRTLKYPTDAVDAKGNVSNAPRGRGKDGAGGFINYERDNGVMITAEPNMPLYRPEHWEHVQWLSENGNSEDPELGCKPLGVPRMGPPDRIVQTPKELFFFYKNYSTFRIIPMNRPLPPVEKWQGTKWYGEASAHWDGDTLVVETVDFTENSWLGFPGFLHTVDMRVTERYTRQGNVLKWEAIVNDPAALVEPWVQNPWFLRLQNADPVGLPEEVEPCGDLTREHFVTKERG